MVAVVVVCSLPENKRYSVMKFNMSLGVDVTNWENVHMEREDNRTVYQLNDTEPEFGEGSEYGKAQRREQRRKKMGYMASKYDHDSQPWMLKLDGKTIRRFKGIREGGAGEHADFWIFTKTGEGKFDALPIEEWYNFMPIARYKTLDIDEAEEQFLKYVKALEPEKFFLKRKNKLRRKLLDLTTSVA